MTTPHCFRAPPTGGNRTQMVHKSEHGLQRQHSRFCFPATAASRMQPETSGNTFLLLPNGYGFHGDQHSSSGTASTQQGQRILQNPVTLQPEQQRLQIHAPSEGQRQVQHAPQAASNNLNLGMDLQGRYKADLSMHRFFTFPLEMRKKYPQKVLHRLAELGLCYVIVTGHPYALIACKYCGFKTNYDKSRANFPDFVMEEHSKCKCRIDAADSPNVPMGDHVKSALNYKFEAHRLYSLLEKLDWQHVEPVDLAKSGFYYTGDGDNVRCVFCNLEVRGWEAGDTPDGEHRRWNPNCPFLRSDRSVMNIKIGSEQVDARHDGISKVNIGVNPFAVTGGLKKYGPNVGFVRQADSFLVTPQDLNIHEWSAPLNSKHTTFRNRLESYKNYWPKSLKQTALTMARAGFFYTGVGDRAICFYCNLGLKDWDPNDDPFVQHCKWNSSCQYLVMCKGADFVQKVLHAKRNIADPVVPKRKLGDHGLHCLKCRTQNVSKVNLPCGHMSFCTACAGNVCPVCNSEIIAEIRVPGFSDVMDD